MSGIITATAGGKKGQNDLLPKALYRNETGGYVEQCSTLKRRFVCQKYTKMMRD